MPIYDMICGGCGHEFEAFVSAPDEPGECPHCLSTETAKLPSAFGGYRMDSGPSSVRPKSAGSFKRSRA